ncbi:ABC transporter permease [Williamsia sp. CHRR-6]|uniref:galactan export ABC transporter permease subunit Wzm/RfbD n=1 Tax=Williamsia sp. CHRR-6 TaxID=2835871 RepID=UPI001BDABE68|nr:ABC transporter permease [Williamsia sp. CHRR-6]MBT0567363.1 ABC transporter permease [Williamsia sp. CHRR-6]
MSTVAPGDVAPRPVASDSRTYRRAFADLKTGFGQSELWLLLGWQDIKQRYRRSLLGPLWITVATGVTAIAMGFLYAELFNADITTFLPHVTLGLIFWNFISQSILEGAVVFSSNDGLIKQIPAPLSVHAYRLVWRQLIIFAHNIVIYLVMFAIFPQPISWTVILVIPGVLLLALNAVWVTIVFGILSTRFRDIGQLLTTVVQLVFFLTPIIWTADSIRARTDGGDYRLALIQLNPMYHYLEITRGPLVGESVALYHWGIVIGCTVAGWALALWVLRNFRARVAYWV